jgi:hypothetical protein
LQMDKDARLAACGGEVEGEIKKEKNVIGKK